MDEDSVIIDKFINSHYPECKHASSLVYKHFYEYTRGKNIATQKCVFVAYDKYNDRLYYYEDSPANEMVYDRDDLGDPGE